MQCPVLYVQGTYYVEKGDEVKEQEKEHVKGVTFDSKSQKWAVQITYNKKNYYIGRYKNKEEAIEIMKEASDALKVNFLEWYNAFYKNRRNKTCIINGKEYETIKDACKKNEISYVTLKQNQVRYNISLEKSFNMLLEKKKSLEVEIEGKIFPSTRAACKAYNIRQSRVIYYKKNYNMTTEQAILHACQKGGGTIKNNRECIVYGKRYDSYVAACEDNNIDYDSAITIKNIKNISIEEAITFVKNSNRGKIKIDGVEYIGRMEACKAIGVTYNAVYNYMQRKNIGFIEAFMHLKIKKMEKDMSATYNALGINYKQLNKIMKENNLTIEEAINIIIKKEN